MSLARLPRDLVANIFLNTLSVTSFFMVRKSCRYLSRLCDEIMNAKLLLHFDTSLPTDEFVYVGIWVDELPWQVGDIFTLKPSPWLMQKIEHAHHMAELEISYDLATLFD
jgi:hypothetical protein